MTDENQVLTQKVLDYLYSNEVYDDFGAMIVHLPRFSVGDEVRLSTTVPYVDACSFGTIVRVIFNDADDPMYRVAWKSRLSFWGWLMGKQHKITELTEHESSLVMYEPAQRTET